jgi:hypothetical protein
MFCSRSCPDSRNESENGAISFSFNREHLQFEGSVSKNESVLVFPHSSEEAAGNSETSGQFGRGSMAFLLPTNGAIFSS